jgi:hypothetical protein
LWNSRWYICVRRTSAGCWWLPKQPVLSHIQCRALGSNITDMPYASIVPEPSFSLLHSRCTVVG